MRFFENDKNFPDGMWEQVKDGLKKIERRVANVSAIQKIPCWFSVRSGAAFQLPGMMDTVLNLGLNEATVQDCNTNRGPPLPLDAYRRFASFVGESVIGLIRAAAVRYVGRGCLTIEHGQNSRGAHN